MTFEFQRMGKEGGLYNMNSRYGSIPERKEGWPLVLVYMTTYRLEATRQAWRLGVGWSGCDTLSRFASIAHGWFGFRQSWLA